MTASTLILHDQYGNEIARQPLAFGGDSVTSGNESPILSFSTLLHQGRCAQVGSATLDPPGRQVPLQAEVLGRWPDGSIRWLHVDVAPGSGSALRLMANSGRLQLDAGIVRFELDAESTVPLNGASIADTPLLQTGGACGLSLIDAAGKPLRLTASAFEVEASGPVRATVRSASRVRGTAVNVICRASFFAGAGLVRLEIMLHNAAAARHAQGLWDLGDPGSFRFQDFSLELSLSKETPVGLHWGIDQYLPLNTRAATRFALRQDSSGGDNWNSPNHMNAAGRVPCAFRGYRLNVDGKTSTGDRATPTLICRTSSGLVGVHVPEFWQQFPKVVAMTGHRLRIGLFPAEFGDTFELQGGERKTHTLWLQFAPTLKDTDAMAAEIRLAAVRLPVLQPVLQSTAPIPDGTDVGARKRPKLDALLEEALSGPRGFIANRETVDEYGWRHYGEIVADHERAYYNGPQPLISHYNNQFDVIYGLLLNYLRTGDARLFELGDALARHVVDIDLYHTHNDRSAYNGGMFWHTDHYRTAYTATHRAYSRHNRPDGADYGGGPSCEHNYTTGLYLHHCLTGDWLSRDAVISLADWVVRMDDGQRTLWRFFDSSPTGRASVTREETFHGPGRGAGNSVNALLDAWQLTGEMPYLDYAETLIKRCIHPRDDIAALDLLNLEARWSYTVFLTALLKYLKLKMLAGRRDRMFHYAHMSLIHYAHWMVENEIPYFDQPATMEYPTETWAAQDLRKANVLRWASAWVDEPSKTRLFDKGARLAQRAWQDLQGFETRSCARPLAILMVEGLKELHAAPATIVAPPKAAPPPENFEPQAPFVTQKQRIKAMLRSPAAALTGIGCLVGYPLRRAVAKKHEAAARADRVRVPNR